MNHRSFWPAYSMTHLPSRSPRPVSRLLSWPTWTAISAALAATALGTVSLVAQELASGTRAGEVVNPDGQIFEVTFDIVREGDALAITVDVPGVAVLPLSDIVIDEDRLSFRWQPGQPISCELWRTEAGGFGGACADATGVEGHMRIFPPGERPNAASAPPPSGFLPGEVHWGTEGFVEFQVGRLPLILSAPHGGGLTPSNLRDRTRGYFTGDSYTQELTRLTADALEDLTGRRPHVVISRLARSKLDPNRGLDEAANGDPGAEIAWREYHRYLTVARSLVTAEWESGLYLDMHGHGHRVPRIELGYLIAPGTLNDDDAAVDASASSIRALSASARVTTAALIRGPQSLGALLEERGYPSVPSPSNPGPGRDDYFNGGYSTVRHGSVQSGTVSGIQLEHPRSIRNDEAVRRAYARDLAEALVAFMRTHYGFDLAGRTSNR